MNTFDCIVVGAGMAGCSAAINMARAGYSVALIDKKYICASICDGYDVDNYVGMSEMSGKEIANNLEKTISHLSYMIRVVHAEVIAIDHINHNGCPFRIILNNNEVYESNTVIAAIGLTQRKLLVDGIRSIKKCGRLSYNGLQDRLAYSGKSVAIIGSDNIAAQNALYLSKICKNVIIINRQNEWQCEVFRRTEIEESDNIRIITDTVKEFSMHDDTILIHGLKDQYTVDGLFISIGFCINDAFIDGNLRCNRTNPNGYNGFYTAGDYQTYDTNVPCCLQSAAYTGMMAAVNAMNFLESL